MLIDLQVATYVLRSEYAGCCDVLFKPTIETGTPLYANIVLNTSDMDGYDQRADPWKQFTVSALKREIFNGARVLCHEIAHALVNYSFGFEEDPAFNEEKMIETGFSLENFIFGGVVRRNTQ
jgi:hypothetical protein